MRMRDGISFTRRNSSSLMPTMRAASAGFNVAGATQAVQLANGLPWLRRLRTNKVALA
jgi:hypothetical protein